MNKQNVILVVIVALLAGALVFAGSFLSKVRETVVNNLGAVSSILDVGPEFGQNGLATKVATGSFITSTTTFVMFASPAPATATIEFVALRNTGMATTTYNIQCGSSYTAGGEPTAYIIRSGEVATSTNFKTIFNNVATSSTMYPINGGLIERAPIGPGQFFLCFADVNDGPNTGSSNAFIGQSTFTGEYTVEFKYKR